MITNKDDTASLNIEEAGCAGTPAGGEAPQEERKFTLRNLFCYSLGTFGRDFLYNFFANYLLSYILYTKTLTEAQFASVSVIIIVARLFDAFNDPIMGGIIENTHTKWGKFKPWQLAGALSTAGVIIATFSVDINGWAFIGFFAAMYFLFSITFTMNDISYWGMLPAITKEGHDRNRMTSLAQLVASGGGGLAGLLIPMLTNGNFTIGGNAKTGFMVVAIMAGVLMIATNLITIIGVKEDPLPAKFTKTERMKIKDMFKVIGKNDQLLWNVVVMVIMCVGTNVVAGGLQMTYLYFEFGYNGLLVTIFGIIMAVTSTLFTITYPWLSKRFGRDRILYSCGIAQVVGYSLMMILGLTIPSVTPGSPQMWAKFVPMMIANGIVGYGTGFYMILVISIANTVEYNEWKTGKRNESLIFSLRPFTAKMGSALMQGVVMIVYLAVGVLGITNQISELENQAASKLISDEAKAEFITNLLAGIDPSQKMALLACMCMIPATALAICMIIYKKKCFLNEAKLAEIARDIEARKAQAELAQGAENADITETVETIEIAK